MLNLRMQEKLDKGDCLDVDVIGTPLEGFPGVWVADDYLDGVDYCSSSAEHWIWSVGRHLQNGRFYFATDTRFYQNPLFRCVWLR